MPDPTPNTPRTMYDPLDNQSYVNSTAFHLLVLELVPTSIRVSKQVNETGIGADTEFEPTTMETSLSDARDDKPGTVGILDSADAGSDDVTLRVENYGFDIGLRISELIMFKSSNQKMGDILDIMKFVCRDVWRVLYGKQMSNLRTNHRGTFVLVDNSYKLIETMMSDKGAFDTVNKCKNYLWFPCGVIRGILMSFGIEAEVHAEMNQFPSVTFNIQTGINN